MQVHPHISVNFSIQSRDSFCFPFSHLGFLLGCGVFETVLIQNGRPVLLSSHLYRMQRAAHTLDIPFDYTPMQIQKGVCDLIKANGVSLARLNIFLVPDDDALGVHDVPGRSLLLMILRTLSADGLDVPLDLAVRETSFQRAPLDGFKSMSYIKNTLERHFSAPCQDVLLYDSDGVVLETTSANVFFVQGQSIVTPKAPAILNGVTRRFLLDNESLFRCRFEEREILFSELALFDEIFVTSACRGVGLVASCEQFDHLKSQHVSRSIQSRYRELISSKEANFV